MGQPCGEHVVVELIVLRVGLSTCIAKIWADIDKEETNNKRDAVY